jgi:hypothetical protein
LHLPQGVISDVKGKHMDNPEYTERQINEALKDNSDLPITASWDGNEPERGETADFEIYFEGETTDVFVWDHGNTFDIYVRGDDGVFYAAGWANRYNTLAKRIIEIIEEDIASGKLGGEEE